MYYEEYYEEKSCINVQELKIKKIVLGVMCIYYYSVLKQLSKLFNYNYKDKSCINN